MLVTPPFRPLVRVSPPPNPESDGGGLRRVITTASDFHRAGLNRPLMLHPDLPPKRADDLCIRSVPLGHRWSQYHSSRQAANAKQVPTPTPQKIARSKRNDPPAAEREINHINSPPLNPANHHFSIDFLRMSMLPAPSPVYLRSCVIVGHFHVGPSVP